MADTPKISKHCVDRFRERSGCKDEQRAVRTIRDMVSKAERVLLKPQYRANMLIKHDFRDMAFMRYNGWIFVLDEHAKNVMTCYSSGELRWVKV